MKREDLRIVFMGTPEFAVAGLDAIFMAGYQIVGVITAPDKPAGRGRKIQVSAVKKYAEEKNLKVLQPTNLKDEAFLHELKTLRANLHVVVAFRMLPKLVWDMPEYGTFNLHASLLPNYRGAAPINHAIINGEKVTGLTTFFLDEKIDTGKIIESLEVNIEPDESAGELHDRMMFLSAQLIIKTIKQIQSGNPDTISQKVLITEEEEIKAAPKIFKEDCRIDWKDTTDNIHNFIRGLSPYPAAFSKLLFSEKSFNVKIFKAKKEKSNFEAAPGKINSDGRSYLKVSTSNGFIHILELQMEGKKRMNIIDFLNGFILSSKDKFQVK